jgi:hypothetical protein
MNNAGTDVTSPDEYHVCRGLVSLLLDRGFEYPIAQVTCDVDRAEGMPHYVVNGNGIGRAVLSELLEDLLGRAFALDKAPWSLDREEACILARVGSDARYSLRAQRLACGASDDV